MKSAAISLAAAAPILVVLASAAAEDWPHWRGPSRNGHSPEPSGWNGQSWISPRPLWTAGVGEGASSPVVAGDRLYVMGWRDGRTRVVCLDLETGKRHWIQEYESPRYARHAAGDEGLYSGPTATPELDAETGLLFTLGADGDLHCWNTAEGGRETWKLNLYDRFDVPQRPKIQRSGLRDYGYTAAPVIYRDWLLVEVGAASGTVVAFNKRTGDQVWTSEYRGEAGHSGSPVPIVVDKAPCLAVFTLRQLVVMRLDSGQEGKTIALYDWETEWANNILTPTVVGQDVLISSYHTHHAIARLHITLQGAQQIWKQPFASHVGSPVVHGGHVYLAGESLYCLDWQTGEPAWKGAAFADGASCVVTADDRLVLLGSKGDLCLAETAQRSQGEYRELARLSNVFGSEAWCHVALARGKLVAKDRSGSLKCWRTR